MSKNNIREALLAQFSEPEKVDNYHSNRILPAKRKGETLADFYTEVFQSSQPLYESKSAKELEVMMMQNRRLIESKNKKR